MTDAERPHDQQMPSGVQTHLGAFEPLKMNSGDLEEQRAGRGARQGHQCTLHGPRAQARDHLLSASLTKAPPGLQPRKKRGGAWCPWCPWCPWPLCFPKAARVSGAILDHAGSSCFTHRLRTHLLHEA